MATQRYDKTPKGHDEITQGRKNLKGKLRTVLFLVDAGKDVASIQQQITLIGAPPDAIAQLATAGYIAPIGGPLTPTNDSVAVNGSSDPVASFRVAKAFMNETIVDARGIRSFGFTLKLERCSTLADLAALMPEYTEGLLKSLDREVVRAMVDRARELVAR
ncbi:MAG: hypothetical protein IT519_03180 [Burkholderiales bacterium]|jgi:hypothetical protein|nr:hypothetical protein [Burkholderiales bacterium]